jgi:hypothetical protein
MGCLQVLAVVLVAAAAVVVAVAPVRLDMGEKVVRARC